MKVPRSNPFVFGSEMASTQLVDRTAEVQTVVRTIRDHGTLFLIGPRRYGKTSILRAADERATATGAVVIRQNAEAYPSVAALVQAVVASAANRLAGPLDKVGRAVTKAFARLRPELSYNSLEQRWGVGLGVERSPPDEQTPLLVDAFTGVAALASTTRRPVAVIIDEFQKVIELGGASAEGQLRAAVQSQPEVAYIFAGSRTAMLNDMTLNPQRPFYRLGGRLFLTAIPRDDFTTAITRGFTAAGFAVTPEAVLRILDVAEDVPYNVQVLANAAWELVRAAGGRLTVEVVTQALAEVVARDDPFYATLWNGLTPTQQQVFLAVALEGGRGLQSGRIARLYHFTPSAGGRALAALEARALVRREERVDDVRWRLEDPFFGAWLRALHARKQ